MSPEISDPDDPELQVEELAIEESGTKLETSFLSEFIATFSFSLLLQPFSSGNYQPLCW